MSSCMSLEGLRWGRARRDLVVPHIGKLQDLIGLVSILGRAFPLYITRKPLIGACTKKTTVSDLEQQSETLVFYVECLNYPRKTKT